MHHRPYRDEVVLNSVVNAEREPMNQIPSDVALHDSPGDRISTDGIYGKLNLLNKTLCQFGIDLIKVTNRLLVLSQSLRVKTVPHCRTMPRAFRRASSPGMSCAAPDPTSCRRRRTSSRWAFSSAGSISASMLSISFSARFALEAGDKSNASLRISFTVAGMVRL
jgi:hypothetical protein